ncbi:MAG: glycosyltransferase family 2 protein [Candidatus Firestonebacteria bacterium]|nr:glycosyltransferase family 2 protein [Candidatus Firestonebacteria bacterium]
MKIAVVIVNYNGKEFLEGCVTSVLEQSLKPSDILVIDAASKDSSKELLKKINKDVKVKFLTSNIGFAGAANIGIRETEGEYVLLLNSDTCLAAEFIFKIRAAAAKLDASYGMLSGKLLRMQDRKIVDSAGQFVRRSLRPLERNYGEPDKLYPAGQCFSACGAVMLLKREMLENVKYRDEYFDEDLFMYYEDFDLGLRANALGWKCYYEPEAVAVHYRGGSGVRQKSKSFLFRKKSLELKRHLLANRYLVLTKSIPAFLVLKNLPHLLAYEIIFWIYLLIFDIRVVAGMKKYFRLRRAMKEKGKLIRAAIAERELEKWFI